MTRPSVTVRDAVPGDASALLALLSDTEGGLARSEGVRAERVDASEASVAEASAAVGRIAADPDERLVVGLVENEVAGVVHLRRAPLSPIRVQESVRVTSLTVAPEHRGKGVGTVLMSVATAWAEEKDAPFVVAVMPARDREANRYVTRLGFTQIGVVRVAATEALRSRFAGMAAGSRDTGRMIAVRKSLRRRHPHLGTSPASSLSLSPLSPLAPMSPRYPVARRETADPATA